jgi:guanosine-diphosphatase
VDVVMAKDALCEVGPCAFGGVYQPSLMETFGAGSIYACVPSLYT